MNYQNMYLKNGCTYCEMSLWSAFLKQVYCQLGNKFSSSIVKHLEFKFILGSQPSANINTKEPVTSHVWNRAEKIRLLEVGKKVEDMMRDQVWDISYFCL